MIWLSISVDGFRFIQCILLAKQKRLVANQSERVFFINLACTDSTGVRSWKLTLSIVKNPRLSFLCMHKKRRSINQETAEHRRHNDTWSFHFHRIIRYTQVACQTMGNLFSRRKDPLITTEDEQFFDCLNDDEPHDEHDQPNTQPAPSHYYAVWVPSNVETTGNEQSTIDSFHMVLLFFVSSRNTVRLRWHEKCFQSL